MKSDFSYDPVTGIDEADAPGETAEIFADIRRTMNIPVVTSIWQGLAGMGDVLRQAWSGSKPIFEAAEPEGCVPWCGVSSGGPETESQNERLPLTTHGAGGARV